MATREDVSQVLKQLGAAYSQAITNEQAEAYYRATKDLPRILVGMAASKAIATIKFFPRPAEILAIAEDLEARSTFIMVEEPLDEAAIWYLYLTGKNSTDELTEKDVKAVYKMIGLDVVRPITTA